ncbi:hypothetical protein AGMMS49925_04570 [Deltaproteobacteria bacterium]|nr:hypothetical protein AGMMS49925_04570 [Deltaproteobacteria bacterium]
MPLGFFAGRRKTAVRLFGSFVVIHPKPACSKILHFLKSFKEILIEPVIAHCPVAAFNNTRSAGL